MPRPSKIEDTYDHSEYWTKMFMYSELTFKNIFPIVEIIRNLENHCTITHKYCKNQSTIKVYGSQYNHRIIGCDFKNNQDYIDNIVRGFVKFIFIFSDTSDIFSKNLLNIAEKYKICAICYSNIDSVYHFYNYSVGFQSLKGSSGFHNPETNHVKISCASDVVIMMRELSDYTSFKKMVDLFPEFDIIPESLISEKPVLEKCLLLLNNSTKETLEQKQKHKIITISANINANGGINDSNLNKIKKQEYFRNLKNIKYDDELPNNNTIISKIDRKIEITKKNNLAQFFKKK